MDAFNAKLAEIYRGEWAESFRKLRQGWAVFAALLDREPGDVQAETCARLLPLGVVFDLARVEEEWAALGLAPPTDLPPAQARLAEAARRLAGAYDLFCAAAWAEASASAKGGG